MTKDAFTIFLREAACLKEGDLSLGFEVTLIADEDDDNVGTGKRTGITEPVAQSVKCLTAGKRTNITYDSVK